MTREPGEIFCLLGANGAGNTTTQEFLAQLQRLRERGKAILMTTHDIFRAKIIADHTREKVSIPNSYIRQ